LRQILEALAAAVVIAVVIMVFAMLVAEWEY